MASIVGEQWSSQSQFKERDGFSTKRVSKSGIPQQPV